MTISEHSGIDDLMVVCLHFAEEEKTSFGDISKNGGCSCLMDSCRMNLRTSLIQLTQDSPYCTTNEPNHYRSIVINASSLRQAYKHMVAARNLEHVGDQCLFLRVWGLPRLWSGTSCRANGTDVSWLTVQTFGVGDR
jgi:hypothetical protein